MGALLRIEAQCSGRDGNGKVVGVNIFFHRHVETYKGRLTTGGGSAVGDVVADQSGRCQLG